MTFPGNPGNPPLPEPVGGCQYECRINANRTFPCNLLIQSNIDRIRRKCPPSGKSANSCTFPIQMSVRRKGIQAKRGNQPGGRTGRSTGGPVSSSGCPISRAQVAREVGSRREVRSKEKSEAKRSRKPSRTEERPQHSASSAALLCVLCVLRFAVSPQSSQTQQDYPHNRRRPSRPRIAQPPPIPNAPENPAPPATGRRRSPRRPFAQ